MGRSKSHFLTTKKALAVGGLAAAIGLYALSAPTIYERYKAYTQGPSDPYRHSPLPDLPPLEERASQSLSDRTISIVQIPPSGNTGAPDSSDQWIIGTPEQIAELGIDTTPKARFRQPSVPFPSSTTVWYIDAAVDQPLADVTFVDRSDDERYKIVKLTDLANRPVADIYMDGNPVRLMVPLGTYQASMSIGRNWEGQETEFGPYGAYIDLGQIALTSSSSETSYNHSIVTRAKAIP